MNNFIIKIKNEPQDKLNKLQLYLFDLGYEWSQCGKHPIVFCSSNYIYNDDDVLHAVTILEYNHWLYTSDVNIYSIDEFYKHLRKQKLNKILNG